jgi:hypothetical protein
MITTLCLLLVLLPLTAEAMRQFAEWEDDRREQRVWKHQMRKLHGKPPRQWPRWLTELWRGMTAKS